jgi:hypothetical protein
MTESSRPELVELHLGDAAERWEALGFTIDDTTVRLGETRLVLGSEGDGITAWGIRGIEAIASIDGLRTLAVGAAAPAVEPVSHPNGAIGIDHVVVVSADFERTARALSEAGVALRRVRDADGFRQGFRRLGGVILELVESREAPAGPARFWGLVVVVEDIEALARLLGDQLGTIRDAVQPGRRIATLRRSAGVGAALAFMDPER